MVYNFNSHRTKCFSAHSIVDKSILEQIRSKSSNPHLYAYVAFHEGHVNPVDADTGKASPMYFSKHAVKQAYDKIEIGTTVFAGHTDSAQEYIFEPGVGKVVGKEMENGNAIIIVHGTKDLDALPSVSAEFDLELDGYDNVIDVTRINGFALLSYEAPAFYGAKKILKVAASEHLPQQQHPLTFNEVQNAVRALNIFPWQLYTKEQLLSDKIVSETVNALTTERDKSTIELGVLKTSTSLMEIKTKIAEVIRINPNLTDQQKMFIQQHADTTDLSKVVDPTVFVNDGLTKFQEQAKLFGVPVVPVVPVVPGTNPVVPGTNPVVPPVVPPVNPNVPQIPNPTADDNAGKAILDQAMDIINDVVPDVVPSVVPPIAGVV